MLEQIDGLTKKKEKLLKFSNDIKSLFVNESINTLVI
jgi:hypothetical protein